MAEEPEQESDKTERPLQGPGSEERLRAVHDRFRAAREAESRMPTYQLVLIGLFIFMLILLFGAGRFVVADLAPKLPPGVNINAPTGPSP